ncbi:hypothetical protein P170DRAFT_432432 [Aspergillus steynii IBT 23096]|uniref:EthD domain-containing protein n=1 Tax=Aspergillus steynii IBT 23096 TaxID=1392250 RepID=A0A2I2GPS4_9EURO|nr:uncharacterized protein P170DRAFT_432432 [Aspergillus steynii IBT 23096]PLB54863.1 hypothetical protein P170DRAFT_432432 [Aspergillus steynii IBT 23096]
MSSCTILAFFSRKPDLTSDEFKAYYETTHMPLIKDIAGIHFPITHKRFYTPRILVGDPADLQVDVYAELTFRDIEHLNAFKGTLIADAERLAEDEERFLDRKKIRVVMVDEPVVSRGEE